MLSILRFKGGLGNQMFQYAFYLSLKKWHPFSCFIFDLEESLYCHSGYQLDQITHTHTIRPGKWYQFVKKHLPRLIRWTHKVKQTNSLEYREEYLQSNFLLTLYDGYWQSGKYFSSIAEKVKKTFRFREELLNFKTHNLTVTLKHKDTISIHVRRGDYLNLTDHFGLCNLTYYQKAIDYFSQRLTNPTFIVFSDDIQWAKENILCENAIYVDWNQGSDSWQDMYLMSQCKHNIIANSSFSWWGAWLNDNPDKIVIAPQKWFNYSPNYDILPPLWTTL